MCRNHFVQESLCAADHVAQRQYLPLVSCWFSISSFLTTLDCVLKMFDFVFADGALHGTPLPNGTRLNDRCDPLRWFSHWDSIGKMILRYWNSVENDSWSSIGLPKEKLVIAVGYCKNGFGRPHFILFFTVLGLFNGLFWGNGTILTVHHSQSGTNCTQNPHHNLISSHIAETLTYLWWSQVVSPAVAGQHDLKHTPPPVALGRYCFMFKMKYFHFTNDEFCIIMIDLHQKWWIRTLWARAPHLILSGGHSLWIAGRNPRAAAALGQRVEHVLKHAIPTTTWFNVQTVATCPTTCTMRLCTFGQSVKTMSKTGLNIGRLDRLTGNA